MSWYVHVPFNDLSSCLPVFVSGSSNSAPPVEQAGLRRGRHLCRYGASCWPPQWEHPGRCQLWGWILVAVRIRPILPRHFQKCPAFQQRLYRSGAFVEDGKEHPQTRRHRPLARHIMSWVPTDVHQECQTSFRTDVFGGMKVWGLKWASKQKTLTIAQDAYTSSQQTYSCPALQQPSCAVSPFLSTTFGLAPLLIRYLIARLGQAKRIPESHRAKPKVPGDWNRLGTF